jgi:hypothetical protein
MGSMIERLECVYYPGPIPCDVPVLTTLCFVFDKIHFPGVYLPKGDYDKELVRDEIQRLEGLESKQYGTSKLIGILKFLEYRLPLDGILEYPSSRDSIFVKGKDEAAAKLARLIYDANFPPRENFEPMFDSSSTKGLPGSDEAVSFRGDFYYQANAINYAADHQLLLLDDGSGPLLPFRARYKDNAKALATMLALECMAVVIPDLPVLSTQELADFRVDNARELKNFRASMLRYAKALNAQIADDASLEELNRKTKFFIETEINPALHDLNRDLMNPNRPWYKRMADGARIISSLGVGYLTGGLLGSTVADSIKAAALSELEAKGDRQEAAKRNGLYYLMRARALKS